MGQSEENKWSRDIRIKRREEKRRKLNIDFCT